MNFGQRCLASMAFPTLFPYGKGYPTKHTRLREVSLTDAFKYLIKYADLYNTIQYNTIVY